MYKHCHTCMYPVNHDEMVEKQTTGRFSTQPAPAETELTLAVVLNSTATIDGSLSEVPDGQRPHQMCTVDRW